jgi:hypothetical protein
MRRLALGVLTAFVLSGCDDAPKDTAPKDTAASPTASDAAPSTTSAADEGAPNIAAPKRQAGLWTFTQVAANGDELSVDSLCVGDLSEAKYSAFRQIGNGGSCTSRTFTRTAAGYDYVTVCGVPGMKPVTTKGKLTGDVATAYTLDETLDISVNGDHQKLVAKRTGDCPADLKDGQMKNGTTGMTYSVLL